MADDDLDPLPGTILLTSVRQDLRERGKSVSVQKLGFEDNDLPDPEESEEQKELQGGNEVIDIQLNSQRIESHRVSQRDHYNDHLIESGDDAIPSPERQQQPQEELQEEKGPIIGAQNESDANLSNGDVHLAVYREDDEQEVFIGDVIPSRRMTRNHPSADKSVFIDEIKVMPPNFNQLTEFINAKHCRRPYTEGDPLDQVRRYPLCSTNMGSFSCLKKDRKSEIEQQGVGVVLYFMFYKYLSVLFMIMFMLSLICIFFFSNGNGLSSESFGWQDALTTISLGNLGDNGEVCLMTRTLPQKVNCETGEVAPSALELFDAVDANGCNERRNTATSQSLGDLVCTVNPNDVKECELTGTSTVLTNLKHPMVIVPCKVSDIQLVGGSIRVQKETVTIIIVIVDVLIVFIFMISMVVVIRWEYLIEYELERDRITVRDFSIEVSNLPPLGQHNLRVQLWEFLERKIKQKTKENAQIIDIQFAYSDNQILFLEMKNKRYSKEEMILKARLNMLDGNNTHAKEVKLIKKIDKLKDKRKRNEEKLAQSGGKKKVVKAFVTFDLQSGKTQAIQTFGISCCKRSCMISCCQKEKLEPYYFHKKWLKVTSAPQPTIIQWENLSFNKCSRCMRRCFSFFVALGLIIVSFSFILVAKYYQNQAQSSQVTCQSQTIITETEAQSDYDLGSNATGMWECFCKNQFFTTQSTSPPQDFCQVWLNRWLEAQAWSIGAIFVISIVNIILVVLLRLLAKFERSHSINSQLQSSTLKIFVATFFNTGLVLLLANANIQISGLRDLTWFPIFAGDYQDFDAEWYQKVGSSIILTMIINIFTPHLPGFSSFFFVGCTRCCDRSCTCNRRKTKKLIQEDYERLYLGPQFLIEYRYSQILNTLYICFMYSSGMPILYLVSALWFMITFAIDKWLYLRLYRSLPHFDRLVHSYMRSLISYSLFLHMALGFWMYSNTQIFLTVFLLFTGQDQQTLKNFVDDNISFFAAERFTSTHSIMMILALAGFIVFYFLRWTIIEKCMKCCSKRRLKLNVVKTDDNILASLDIYSLEDRDLSMKMINYQVSQEHPEMKDKTRELTDKIRRLISKEVQSKVNEINPNFGRISNANGRIDPHRLNLFIQKFKEKITMKKINGLQSYVMTENEKYRELVEWRRHNIADRHSSKPLPPDNKI